MQRHEYGRSHGRRRRNHHHGRPRRRRRLARPAPAVPWDAGPREPDAPARPAAGLPRPSPDAGGLPPRPLHHHLGLQVVVPVPRGRHLGRLRRRRDLVVPGRRGVRAADGGRGVGDAGGAPGRRTPRGAGRPGAGVRLAPAVGAPRGAGRRRGRRRVHDADVRRGPRLRRGVGRARGPAAGGRRGAAPEWEARRGAGPRRRAAVRGGAPVVPGLHGVRAEPVRRAGARRRRARQLVPRPGTNGGGLPGVDVAREDHRPDGAVVLPRRRPAATEQDVRVRRGPLLEHGSSGAGAAVPVHGVAGQAGARLRRARVVRDRGQPRRGAARGAGQRAVRLRQAFRLGAEVRRGREAVSAARRQVQGEGPRRAILSSA